MIDKTLVDEVLSRTDIESVISPYVSLKRAGSLTKGLCPFHSEKTPSFVVYPKDNSFYCFGCGAGGDAITFLKKMENMDFEDAVEALAKRAGIPFVRKEDKEQSGPRFDRNRMLELNREAARYFHAHLFDNTQAAEEARRYLLEKRGLSMAVVKHFGLGFAPYDPRGFAEHFFKLGYREDELIAAFLLGKGDRGLYQSFRDRVMFPIIDVAGNVIAFGGRILSPNASPQKYKNSSDTPVYKKSKNLYALNFARQSCAEELVLCEGYMDTIAMHAAGVTNAAATLGTAITPEQARLISHYTKRVILSYDSDEAGQRATARAIALLEQVGLTVSVLRMEGAKDPDEYIGKFGVDAFRQLIKGSQTKFEFNLSKVLSKHNLQVPQEKIAACAELVSIISEVYSSAEREIYIAEVAKRLGLDAANIKNDVARKIARNNREKSRAQTDSLRQAAAGYGDRINPDRIKNPHISNCENSVLSLMLSYPDHRKAAFLPPFSLTEDDFFTAFGKRIFVYLRDFCQGPTLDNAAMNERFSDDEVGRITEIRISRMELTDNGDAVFRESVEALRRALTEHRFTKESTSLSDLDSMIRAMREKK